MNTNSSLEVKRGCNVIYLSLPIHHPARVCVCVCVCVLVVDDTKSHICQAISSSLHNSRSFDLEPQGRRSSFFLACFLGPRPRHMEIPRPGVELELQLPAYPTATATKDPSPHLLPTPQLMGTLDPQPSERGQGSNLHPYGY